LSVWRDSLLGARKALLKRELARTTITSRSPSSSSSFHQTLLLEKVGENLGGVEGGRDCVCFYVHPDYVGENSQELWASLRGQGRVGQNTKLSTEVVKYRLSSPACVKLKNCLVREGSGTAHRVQTVGGRMFWWVLRSIENLAAFIGPGFRCGCRGVPSLRL
jgi:hypothetical protein